MWNYEPLKHWVISTLAKPSPKATGVAQGSTRSPEGAHEIDVMRLSMQPSFGLKQKISAIKKWDKKDTRIKKIHNRISRDCVRGGLILDWNGPSNDRINQIYKQFINRLQLNNIAKLKSDARQFCVQGNLAMQWVYDPAHKCISQGISMPVETLVPNTLPTGDIADPRAAYYQVDAITGKKLATFAQWQLTLVRLDPDNFDDLGSLGRPYLDAVEKSLQQLEMTEEDLVIRRRVRAGYRSLFALKGACEPELKKFENEIMTKRHDVSADYIINSEATVHTVGGDANLDQIADVTHLLNTVFAAAPGPKSLFGYTEDTNRDILEDLQKVYYEEIDELQDTLASAYWQGFVIELLINGIDPDAHDCTIKFMERRTESRNQKADLALKLQATGASQQTVFKTAGIDPDAEQALIEDERKRGIDQNKEQHDDDPEGENDSNVGDKPKVTITEKNAKKNESATDITN